VNTFSGLFPPLITPFQQDGRLNEQGLRDHVDFVIANGADGFCGGSSTGEFMNLTHCRPTEIRETGGGKAVRLHGLDLPQGRG